MKRFICVIVLLVVCCGATSLAATHTAASCSQGDVQAAINAASSGDTVRIPAGNCTWSSRLTVSKGITLSGAGEGLTVIIDNVPKPTPAIYVNAVAPSVRLTGFTLQGMAPDTANYNQAHIQIHGQTDGLRIDHITINNPQTSGIRVLSGCVYGVIDHLTFNSGQNYKHGVDGGLKNCGGKDFGDWSWSNPIDWGGPKALYVEDSKFTSTLPTMSTNFIDAYDGARMVIRHNQFIGGDVGSHGTDSGQRMRGLRQMEIYENTFTFTSQIAVDRMAWIRGGTGVVFNNTISGMSWLNMLVKLANCRDPGTGCTGGAMPIPWGWCDGTSPYDTNVSGQSGYRCVDQPGAGTSRDLGGLATPTATAVGNALDPVYIWNNTSSMTPSWGMGAGTVHVQQNRDFYVGTPRPGYSPYTYPHPLQQASVGGGGDGTATGGVATTTDGTAPVPGGGGAIIASVAPDNVLLSWSKATDNATAQASLLYEVRLSTNNDIDTVAKAEAYGAIVKPYTADISLASVSGLPPGATYYFNVIVKDSSGNKAIYVTKSATAPVVDSLSPIVGNSGAMTASAGGPSAAILAWAKATDNVTAQSALQYEVRRSSSNNISSVATAEANGIVARPYTSDISSTTVTGLAPSSTYYFNVIVRDSAGNKAIYSTRSVTTTAGDSTAPVPGAGGAITTSNVGSGRVTLNWGKASDDASPASQTSYEVRYSTSNNIDSVLRAEAYGTIGQQYTADIGSATLTGLSASTSYYFNIIAKDASGNRAAYVPVNATTAGDTTAPVPGNSGQMTSTSNSSSITLNWTRGSDNSTPQSVLRYEVRFSTTNNIGMVITAETNGMVLKPYTSDLATFTATGLNPGTDYFFNVIVKDEAGNKAVYVSKMQSTTGRRMTQLNPNGKSPERSNEEHTARLFPDAAPSDTTAPTPGGSGLIAVSSASSTGLTLRWTKATDDMTPAGYLQYQVLRSTTKNINTVAEAEVNGTPLSAFTADIDSFVVTGLNGAAQSYFTVLVKDAAGNRAVYSTAGNLGGTYTYLSNGGMSIKTTSAQVSGLNVNQLRVSPSQGTAPPVGVAIIRATSNSGVISTAGMNLSGGIRGGALYADLSTATNTADAVRTGIALANPSTQDAEISFFFTDANGIEVKSGLYMLLANHQISGFLDESPFNGPATFKGTFTFSSSAPISATGTRSVTRRSGEHLLESLPISGRTSLGSSALIPAFVDGNGWSTELVLTNTSSALQVGTIQFRGQGAPGVAAPILEMTVNGVTASSFNYSVQPRSVIRMVTSGSNADLRSGSAQISSTISSSGVPEVLAILTSRTDGTTVSETSLTAAATGTAFRSYVEASNSPEWVNSSIAIVNSADTPNTVNLELMALNGTPLASTSVTLPANGQVAQFVTDLFPAVRNGFRGVLRLNSSAPVSLAAFRYTANSAGQFLIASTPPHNEAVIPPSSGLSFPLVASGAGYDTQVILFGHSGQSGSGELLFISRDGEPQTASSLSLTSAQ